MIKLAEPTMFALAFAVNKPVVTVRVLAINTPFTPAVPCGKVAGLVESTETTLANELANWFVLSNHALKVSVVATLLIIFAIYLFSEDVRVDINNSLISLISVFKSNICCCISFKWLA